MAQTKPNVLIIYPDQLRYDSCSYGGNPTVKTPGLDRLVSEGAVFNNAYTSFPLCCPFRASIMTGKYAHSNGMYANHYKIPLDQEFLPQILNDSGYDTAWIGKWHLSGGNKAEFVEKEYRLGFETFVGFTRGHQYHKSVFYKNDDRTPRKSKQYEPEYQTGHFIDFLDENAKKDKPFFAGISFGLPHPPLDMDPWFRNLYKPEDVVLNENVPEEEREKAKEFMAQYYGLVSCVDIQIMRIINELDRRNLSDNTMIIIVSDHGEFGGEHGRYGKRSYFNASMHVPFIIKYPNKVEKGQVFNNLCDPSVDIFATVMDACGLNVPDYAHGNSLMSQLEGKGEVKRDKVYYELIKQANTQFDKVTIPERGFRTLDNVYVAKNGEPFAYYDLKKDPNELNNLINSAEHKEQIGKMHEELLMEMEKTNDDWDLCFKEGIEGFKNHASSSTGVQDLWSTATLEP